MNKFIVMALICVLAGCASNSPLPPSASGELVPVNSAEVINNV